jgi:hypothetical protein
MTIGQGSFAASLCVLTSLCTVASARTPLDFLEVVAVTPSRVIEHEVDLKGPFDNDSVETFLEGPKLFSHAVGFRGKAVRDPTTFLNWYRIAKPAAESQRVLSVRDSMRGKHAYRITIEKSVFLLSPAQRITSGPPAQIPAGLNYFKAYKIIDGSKIRQKVELANAFGPVERVATQASLLCVPAEKWHHDEHFPIKNPQACMVVYELLPGKCEMKLTTLDLFGMNKMEARSGKWLCVPAEIVEGSPAKTE